MPARSLPNITYNLFAFDSPRLWTRRNHAGDRREAKQPLPLRALVISMWLDSLHAHKKQGELHDTSYVLFVSDVRDAG